MKVYEVNNLFFSYDALPVLENVSFSIEEGEFVGIIGENGAGKSTLIKLLIGDLKANKSIRVMGSLIEDFKTWEDIGYVSQVTSSINFPISCKELIYLNLHNQSRSMSKKERETIIESALRHVGMLEYKNKNFLQLSGGQKQKIKIAKALVKNPKILIFDEPTKGIDSKSRKQLFEFLDHLNKVHKITIILVTHDFQENKSYFTKVLKVGFGGVECLAMDL